MEIVFVRHAEPEWVHDGHPVQDPPLTARGQQQARLLAVRLTDLPVDEIWVSPARRAHETCAPLAESLGLPARELPWLTELHLPDFQGRDLGEVENLLRSARRRPLEAWWSGLPGGEAPRTFIDRVCEGLDGELATRGVTFEREARPWLWQGVPRRGRVLVVSHAGTSGVAISHLLGLEQVPWAWERFRLGHAAIAVLRTVAIAHGVIFSLRAFNDAEHLPEDERTT